MKNLFENWRKYINEETSWMGGTPGLAGGGRNNMPVVRSVYPSDEDTPSGEDLSRSVKAVMHRNGKVLLLKNEKGWDLPGGHMKKDEDILSALKREVFEETGLDIMDPKVIVYKHDNKIFFQGAFGSGEVNLSDEHQKYGYFDLEKVKEFHMEGTLSDPYLRAIDEVLSNTTVYESIFYGKGII